MQEGVGTVFTNMIDPGQPPRGFKGEMKLHSDKTHQ